MSEGSDPKKWLTHGVFWREFAAGDAADRPLAEWAYRTPQFPDGITATDLRLADATTQRATIAFQVLPEQGEGAGGNQPCEIRPPSIDTSLNKTPTPSPSFEPRPPRLSTCQYPPYEPAHQRR